jgi:hypothetical protein
MRMVHMQMLGPAAAVTGTGTVHFRRETCTQMMMMMM